MQPVNCPWKARKPNSKETLSEHSWILGNFYWRDEHMPCLLFSLLKYWYCWVMASFCTSSVLDFWSGHWWCLVCIPQICLLESVWRALHCTHLPSFFSFVRLSSSGTSQCSTLSSLSKLTESEINMLAHAILFLFLLIYNSSSSVVRNLYLHSKAFLKCFIYGVEE